MNNYQHYSAGSPKSTIKPLLTLVALVMMVIVSMKLAADKFATKIISPLANEDSLGPVLPNLANPIKKPQAANPDQLILQIKSLLDKTTGNYSVYIYDLNQKQGFGFNETTIFTAASVNKLAILAALYYEAQKGAIDLDKRITVQPEDIQAFGTGIIQNEGPGGVYSLKTLAQILIENSDNTAGFILTHTIGENRIQDLVDDWGMIQTHIQNNKTSNLDMAKLLTKMFQGQIANQALTTEMTGFLDDSDFETRLPKLLPKTVKVYHKIGTEIGVIHDVGIIALEKKPYYLGVMVNDVVDEPETETMIAQISKMVYEFMIKNTR